MAVRTTESRIPAGLQPSDLGQAETAGDDRCALVSFVTSPIVVGRDNTYVVFVTDPGLAASAASYAWSFSLDEGPPDLQTTGIGEFVHRPGATGALGITVKILDGSGAEHASIAMSQAVVASSPALEALFEAGRNEQGPTVANPDAARELVNEHNLYYQAAAPTAPEPGDAFKTFLFTMAHDGALEQAPPRRRERLDRMAAALNENQGDFAEVATGGFGLCAIRMGLLAMTTPTTGGGPGLLLDWTELPEAPSPHATAEAALREALGQLPPEARADLFNRARFPKSNLANCARILEVLRDRYFPGAPFADVLTGMAGTRAHWIVRHYREGPLLRA